MSIHKAIEEAKKHCRFHNPDCLTCIFAEFGRNTFCCVIDGRSYDLSDTRDNSQSN